MTARAGLPLHLVAWGALGIALHVGLARFAYGVVLPSLIVVGLMAIPYIDTNPKGNGEKVMTEWYAGKQYDDDTENAKQVLAELDKYYPGAKGYEVVGKWGSEANRDAELRSQHLSAEAPR